MSAEYTYRRKLRASELMPAVAAGLGLALAGFYVVRILLQRTPVVPRPLSSDVPARLRPPRPPALTRSTG